MTDVVDSMTRSRMMSKIRSRNTKPEIAVRSLLHQMGYRFRIHRKDLPGKPDIVLPKYSTIILVHGCFWHQHPRCRYAYQPKSRVEFWQKKFEDNIKRDRRVRRELKKQSWKVIVVWECELRKISELAIKLDRLLQNNKPA
jgi:DNA mismatch endonuclease (patch repair protein)